MTYYRMDMPYSAGRGAAQSTKMHDDQRETSNRESGVEVFSAYTATSIGNGSRYRKPCERKWIRIISSIRPPTKIRFEASQR
jgi:hypothetical protein